MAGESASAVAFHAGSDALGVYARASVDPKVYGETAILKTAYWFTDQYYLFLAADKNTGLFNVEFRLKQGDSIEKLKEACAEFCNNLLDQAVRQRVLEETSAVRDSLLRKAFFEAKTPLPKGMISNETRLAQPGQSYRDDPVKAGSAD